MKYILYPISLKTAKDFIDTYHRHNSAPQGHKFSIGLMCDNKLIGVIIVGRPVSRYRDNGITAEVTRCCVLDNYKNANSMLYAAAWRAVKAMGYQQLITYNLKTESGASLRGAGFEIIGNTKANKAGWSVPSRPRKIAEKYPHEQKNVWAKGLKQE